MGFGLKFRITGSYIILISLGMLLTDCVVITLWQRDTVRSHVKSATSILQMVADSHPVGVVQIKQKLMLLHTENLIARAIYYNNEVTLLPPVDGHMVLRKTVRFATASTLPIVRFYGRVWGVFSPAPGYVVVAYSLRTSSSPVAIALLVDLKPVYGKIISDHKLALVYMLFNALILGVIGLFRMIEIILKPLERLVQLADGYSEAGVAGFSVAEEGQQLKKLAFSLNTMVRRIEDDKGRLKETIESLEKSNKELKESKKSVVTAEKMAAVGVFSAGMAHEIGNPLGVVQGYLELLADDSLEAKERRLFVKTAVAEIDRVNSLIRQLLDFASPVENHDEEIEIEKLLCRFDAMIIGHKGVQYVDYTRIMDFEEPVYIKGGESLLQVLLNCFLNGLDAVQENKEADEKIIRLRCCLVESDKQKNIEICIEDNGIGIEEEKLTVVFDPFYTTKEPGKGTGLGLSVSYSLVEAMAGKIWVTSEVGSGTVVHILLPISDR